ncbi:Uncharacterised protein [Mycobacteroides abscessus subsp. abscessus]|nr:Uncharacterised protein [Mycobacteroides abscessus subsp. abscessus]
MIGVHARVFQQLMHRDIEDACGVIGTFDVATDPVQRFRVSGQHQRHRPCCCCCCCT